MKKNEKKAKDNKIMFIGILILVVVVIGVICYLLFNKNDELLSIDVVSDKVEYTYGPGGYTESKVKIGDTLKIKILSDKESSVKCYTTSENILRFKDKTSIEVVGKGNASIYCKRGNVTSNGILVEVK